MLDVDVLVEVAAHVAKLVDEHEAPSPDLCELCAIAVALDTVVTGLREVVAVRLLDELRAASDRPTS